MTHSPRIFRAAAMVVITLAVVGALPILASALDGDEARREPVAEIDSEARDAPETVLVMDAALRQPVEYRIEELEQLRVEAEKRFGPDVALRLEDGEYRPIPGAPSLVCVETPTDRVCGESRELVEATIEEAIEHPSAG